MSAEDFSFFMKIAIDCADLDSERIDGTRVYIKNVLDLLGGMVPQNDFLLFHRQEFNPALKPKNFPNYQDRKIPYSFAWTQTRLAFELLKEKPAVCWMPIQQIPMLVSGKVKTVFTAHDLAFKFFPQCFAKKDLWKLNFFTDSAVRRADGIIAVSQSTRNDLLKVYPFLDEKKIKVIYHGFNEQEFLTAITPEKIDQVLQKFGLKKAEKMAPFLLYVGAIQPRKNLITLVEAFEKIKTKNKNDLKLVLAGAPAWLAEETLDKARQSVFAQDIILTGGVSFEEIRVFYKKAEMLVYPSLYEGFGLTILEAWASETPVIVGDNSSLREVGREAVEKFSPFSIDQLTAKIELLLKDGQRRKDLVKKGKKELEKFSWEKCAKATGEFLKEIAEKND